MHSHKDGTGQSQADLYEEYYLQQIVEILGGKKFERYDLGGVAQRLVSIQPRIVRLPSELVRTGANSRQRYSSRTDVRDDPARQAAAAADGKNWVFEDLAGYFLPDKSGGRIQRELFFELKRRPSMIRFLKDCLASEVDYALSRIRKI